MRSTLNPKPLLCRCAVPSRFLLLVLLMLAPARSSFAQWPGLLPEPVTSADLLRYGERLEFSPAQWPAIEALHDEYKLRYQTYRDGPASELAQKFMNGQQSQSLESMREFLKDTRSMRATIALHDRRFFDGFQDLLSESQIEVLPRVRMLRERQRARSQSMMWGGMGEDILDLSEVFFDLDLPESARLAADPLVAQYERRLTQARRELQALVDDISLDMFRMQMDFMAESEAEAEAQAAKQDESEDADSADSESRDEEDEELLEQRQIAQMERRQAAYQEITADLREKTSKLREYNRRLARRIEEALPAPHGREFRLEYYRRAYPMAAYTYLPTHRIKAKVADLADLTPERAASITEQLDAYELQIDSQIEQLIDVLDRQKAWQAENMFGYNDDSWLEIWEERNSIQEALEERTNEMLTHLRDTIGMEQTGQLLGDDAQRWFWMIEQMDMQAQAEEQMDESAESIDPNQDLDHVYTGLLPSRLSVQELKQCAEALELDDAEYTVLEAMRDDYSAVFRQIYDRDITPISEMEDSLWNWDDETGELHVSDDAERSIKRQTTLRRKALKAIMEAEDDFYQQVEMALVNDDARHEALARIRLARRRTIYRQDGGMYGMMSMSFGGEEGEYEPPELDLLIRKLQWPDETLASIESLLIDYERELTDLLKGLYQTALEVHEGQQMLSIEYRRLMNQGEDMDMTAIMEVQQKYMDEPSTRALAAEQAIKECQEGALDTICAALPDDKAAQLRETHRRRAYPHVYSDALAVLDQVAQARTLEDLSSDQQQTLDQLALDYRIEYAAACDRLIDLYISREQVNFMYASDLDEEEQQAIIQRFMEQRQQTQKIMFERTELNTRAIRQLKTSLTVDQLRRIGTLPDPAGQPRRY